MVVIEPPDIPFVIVDDAVQGTQGYEWDYQSTWAVKGYAGVAGWYQTTLSYTGTTNSDAEITFNGTTNTQKNYFLLEIVIAEDSQKKGLY